MDVLECSDSFRFSCFSELLSKAGSVSAPDKNYLRALFEKRASVIQYFQLAHYFFTSLLFLRII